MMRCLKMICKVRDKFQYEINSIPAYHKDVVSSLKFDNFAALRPRISNFEFHFTNANKKSDHHRGWSRGTYCRS